MQQTFSVVTEVQHSRYCAALDANSAESLSKTLSFAVAARLAPLAQVQKRATFVALRDVH